MLSERLLLHPLIRDTLSDSLASWSWKASLRRWQLNYDLEEDEEMPALQGNRRKAKTLKDKERNKPLHLWLPNL